MTNCKHCHQDISIRNPSGYCDHLYYPDNCKVCQGTEEDSALNPSHYKDSKIEHWDVVDAWELCYLLGNCTKYIARRLNKGKELEDLEKAAVYLDRKIEQVKKNYFRADPSYLNADVTIRKFPENPTAKDMCVAVNYDRRLGADMITEKDIQHLLDSGWSPEEIYEKRLLLIPIPPETS